MVFTQLGDVLVWLLVRAASESERKRPPLRVAIPAMHTQQPAIQSRHVCYIVSTSRVFFCSTSLSAQRHFPSISLPTYVELLTQYPIYHGGCYMMALLTSFRLCQKEKKKRVWGFRDGCLI